MQRLLVIEDHKILLRSLQLGLAAAGYEVVATDEGETGFYRARTESFDAVLLDVVLPDRSGLEILRDLRSGGFAAPVLILSGRDSVADRVSGLDEGADDYLVKPFAFEELLARLRAQLNREIPGRRIRLTAGDLELDVPMQRAVRAGREIELSKQECRLLEYLIRSKNAIVSRQAIIRDVWAQPDGISTNIVEVYINALRKKLERPRLKKLIHTVRGAGYALYDEEPRLPATTEPTGVSLSGRSSGPVNETPRSPCLKEPRRS